jgi:tetratricopeptide (TPR) repeat protein
LNPNYATAHQWYAELLGSQGRYDESIASARRGLELDPLSMIMHHTLGASLAAAGRYDEALPQLLMVRDSDPRFFLNYLILAEVFIELGREREAVEAWQEQSLIFGFDDGTRQVETVYGESGLHGVYRWFLLSEEDPFARAAHRARLGEADQAIEELENAFAERSAGMVQIRFLPPFKTLRGDPRFEELIRRVGI